jgi:hypothetical protein
MWALAIIAGIAGNVAGLLLADRSSRAGRLALARLAQLARWPVLAASIAVAVGLARHGAGWTLAWLALAIIGVGLAGQAIFLAGFTVRQLRRGGRRGGRGGDRRGGPRQ